MLHIVDLQRARIPGCSWQYPALLHAFHDQRPPPITSNRRGRLTVAAVQQFFVDEGLTPGMLQDPAFREQYFHRDDEDGAGVA